MIDFIFQTFQNKWLIETDSASCIRLTSLDLRKSRHHGQSDAQNEVKRDEELLQRAVTVRIENIQDHQQAYK